MTHSVVGNVVQYYKRSTLEIVFKTKSLVRQIGDGLIYSIEGKYGVICKTDAFIIIRQISFGKNVYLINDYQCS